MSRGRVFPACDTRLGANAINRLKSGLTGRNGPPTALAEG
jgi:hypothetical protein